MKWSKEQRFSTVSEDWTWRGKPWWPRNFTCGLVTVVTMTVVWGRGGGQFSNGSRKMRVQMESILDNFFKHFFTRTGAAFVGKKMRITQMRHVSLVFIYSLQQTEDIYSHKLNCSTSSTNDIMFNFLETLFICLRNWR